MRWLSVAVLCVGCRNDTGIDDMLVDGAVLSGQPGLLHLSLLVGGNWNLDSDMTLTVRGEEGRWECPVKLRGTSVGLDVSAISLAREASTVGLVISNPPVLVLELFDRYRGLQMNGGLGLGFGAHILSNKAGVGLGGAGLGIGLGVGIGWDSIDLKPQGDCEQIGGPDEEDEEDEESPE